MLERGKTEIFQTNSFCIGIRGKISNVEFPVKLECPLVQSTALYFFTLVCEKIHAIQMFKQLP